LRSAVDVIDPANTRNVIKKKLIACIHTSIHSTLSVTMASTKDLEELQAALNAKNVIIEVQRTTIEQLREQVRELLSKQLELAGPSKPAKVSKKPAPPLHVVKPPAPEPELAAEEHVVPKAAQEADYVLNVAAKAVAMKTFKTYAKGPVTKTALYYQALTYLRSVCKNGVDEQTRAMDAFISYHGVDSELELGHTEIDKDKFVVSFDTWETVFAAAGFVPGPSAGYAPVNAIAKITSKTASGTKSSATQSKTNVTAASVARSYKVVPRTAEA
jgi:hypothetical protein